MFKKSILKVDSVDKVINVTGNDMKDIRCPFCNRKHGQSKHGSSVEVVCLKCGFEFTHNHKKSYQKRLSDKLDKK